MTSSRENSGVSKKNLKIIYSNNRLEEGYYGKIENSRKNSGIEKNKIED